MAVTIDGSGTITGASTLATTVVSPTLTTPNIDSAQFATVSGSAPIFPCRAWVNFNGTGTVAIRASGNVSSITDNGTGDYTVNFTTAMVDVNYAVVGSCYFPSGSFSFLTNNESGGGTTSAYKLLLISHTGSATDNSFVSASVFR